jgi:hypothetical protein
MDNLNIQRDEMKHLSLAPQNARVHHIRFHSLSQLYFVTFRIWMNSYTDTQVYLQSHRFILEKLLYPFLYYISHLTSRIKLVGCSGYNLTVSCLVMTANYETPHYIWDLKVTRWVGIQSNKDQNEFLENVT